MQQADYISIHTPARGVTLRDGIAWVIVWNFNPHSRTGSDDDGFHELLLVIIYFNPHSRTGSDLMTLSISDSISRFQSTLPHGE